MKQLRILVAVVFCMTATLRCLAHETTPFDEQPLREFGFAKVDITPETPLRLAGYGARKTVFEGVDEKLFGRVMVMREQDASLAVLVSVDSIGFPGILTSEIQQAVETKHGVARARFVICSTHTHNAPVIARGLSNIFAEPMTDQQSADIVTYTETVRQSLLDAVDRAVKDLAPGRMYFAEGEVGFAINRRVLNDGVWSGFGENPRGPVDHAFPLLKITDATGETVRGLIFNYACHCTSLGYRNRVNGDWAGYTTKALEEIHSGATAMCCIGCGADANPPRDHNDFERALKFAKASAAEIVDEVAALIETDMVEVPPMTVESFGFAGLPIKRPSTAELEANLKSDRPQVRRHAETMLATQKRMGRLPETQPMPIQVWRFGKDFAMVFLSGEVVADYALRLKKELPGKLWVSAYANDVFGYVASERMQSEGGYEVDFSMIYYSIPGRWESGTEDIVVERVHELFADAAPNKPLSLNDSLKTFTVPEGYRVEVVAAEPLIRDPVHFAVAPDGRLWVVEMGDYPLGDDGKPGGRIRILTDTDQDGRYDNGVTYLDNIPFPTGVMPWGDGAVVMASPDLLFVRDTNGDGRVDERTVLWTGFDTGNAQHLMNGFTYGLDDKLYMAGGTRQPTVTNPTSGESVEISKRDARFDPTTGTLEPLSGQSQYGRARDDWGEWFGNTNSEPLFHYALDDTLAARNPYVASPSSRVFLTTPAVAPRVYPTSRTVGRFNDLFAANRFTSACSPAIGRDATFGSDATHTAFICEPVHNLISRVALMREGVTFRGDRLPQDAHNEFLSSNDNWSRPVFCQTGPDGGLWFADMYRHVIEHPEWIPESWQASLDLYAGNKHGRIYRVVPVSHSPSPTPNFAVLSTTDLVSKLADTNGWVRDTSHRLLIDRADADAIAPLRKLLRGDSLPLARLHALSTLAKLKELRSDDLAVATSSDSAELVRAAILLSYTQFPDGAGWNPVELAQHDDILVRNAVALAIGDCTDADLKLASLKMLVSRDLDDPWQRAAIISSSVSCAEPLLTYVVASVQPSVARNEFTSQLIATSLGDDVMGGTDRLLTSIEAESGNGSFRLGAMADLVEGLAKRKVSVTKLARSNTALGKRFSLMCGNMNQVAKKVAHHELISTTDRVSAIRFLGQAEQGYENRDVLLELLNPATPPEIQSAAIQALLVAGFENGLLGKLATLTPNMQRELLASLQTRADGFAQIVDALESNTLPADAIDVFTRDAILHHPWSKLRTRAERIFASGEETRQEVINQFQSALQLSGVPARGREQFKTRCATCHQHLGVGKVVGPQLSALQAKSDEFFLTAILDPNRAVESKYRAYTIVTSQGLVHSGMVTDESATAITIAKPDGKQTTILRRDIDDITSGRSFMPEGLEKDLTPQDIADLLAFIRIRKS